MLWVADTQNPLDRQILVDVTRHYARDHLDISSESLRGRCRTRSNN
jgi:hypothetical protein